MTDTPVVPPPTKGERIKAAIGDLARPFAIYSTAGATAWAIIDHGTDPNKLGAAGLILAAIFGAKTYENKEQAKQAAAVEVAKATSAPALATANNPTAPAPTAPPGDGELPLSQQIR